MSARPRLLLRDAATLVGGVAATYIAARSALPGAWIGAVIMTAIALLVSHVVRRRGTEELRDTLLVAVLFAISTFVLAYLYSAVFSALVS